jgi:tetratricopeptide (TPR) repeat protein
LPITSSNDQILPYLHLIPLQGKKNCSKFFCQHCKNTWWIEYEFYDRDGSFNYAIDVKMCDCKMKLMENFNKLEYERHLHMEMSTWTFCSSKAIYCGYFDQDYSKYFDAFKDFLDFQNNNQFCNCYWPEISLKAREINGIAYDLFYNLFKNSPLRILSEDFEEQVKFTRNDYCFFNYRGLSILCISHSFLFSHYLKICNDLEKISNNMLSLQDNNKVQNEIENIIDKLSLLFLGLYLECHEIHESLRISDEINLISHDLSQHTDLIPKSNICYNKYVNCSDSDFYFENGYTIIDPYYSYNKYNNFQFNSIDLDEIDNNYNNYYAKILLYEGVSFSEALMYESALQSLNQSISNNPLDFEAYIERAYIHFEIDLIENAIRDYQTAIKLQNSNIFSYYNIQYISDDRIHMNPYQKTNFSIDFELGLVLGISIGAKESAIEFIPSTLSTIRGIGNGIWVFANDPNPVTREFLESCYRLIEYIRDNFSSEYLESTIPELNEIINKWNGLSEYNKGYKIGHIIGKYGVDILIPGTTFKAIKRFRDFRKANALITIEKCASSIDSKKRILAESAKRFTARKNLSKSGKIKINWMKQDKHYPGTNNFISSRSEITISKDRLEELLLNKAGTGTKVRGDVPFTPGYKERIDFGEIIGKYAYKDGSNIVKLETNKGIIHYAKDDVHVVPCAP